MVIARSCSVHRSEKYPQSVSVAWALLLVTISSMALADGSTVRILTFYSEVTARAAWSAAWARVKSASVRPLASWLLRFIVTLLYEFDQSGW